MINNIINDLILFTVFKIEITYLYTVFRDNTFIRSAYYTNLNFFDIYSNKILKIKDNNKRYLSVKSNFGKVLFYKKEN